MRGWSTIRGWLCTPSTWPMHPPTGSGGKRIASRPSMKLVSWSSLANCGLLQMHSSTLRISMISSRVDLSKLQCVPTRSGLGGISWASKLLSRSYCPRMKMSGWRTSWSSTTIGMKPWSNSSMPLLKWTTRKRLSSGWQGEASTELPWLSLQMWSSLTMMLATRES